MKKILRTFSHYLVWWIFFFSLLSYFFPEKFKLLRGSLEYLFTITMFCVGILLNPGHLKLLKSKPYRVVSGTALQYSIMPFTSFLISLFYSDSSLKTGIIITGAVPGAMASNLMSALAGADVALSVSVTTLSTLLSPILTPFFLKIFAGAYVSLSFRDMFLKIMWMVVLPVLLGYRFRIYSPKVQQLNDYFSGIAGLSIILIVSFVVAENAHNLTWKEIHILWGLILLNAVGYAGGYWIPLLLKWPVEQRRTISLEVGMQNAGLGTVLALSFIGERPAISPAIYTFLCLITSSILVNLWKREDFKS